jgi:hypothetical protein
MDPRLVELERDFRALENRLEKKEKEKLKEEVARLGEVIAHMESFLAKLPVPSPPSSFFSLSINQPINYFSSLLTALIAALISSPLSFTTLLPLYLSSRLIFTAFNFLLNGDERKQSRP